MSNGIRFDSLLVRDLAAELDGLLAGQRLRAIVFDREARRVHLLADALSLSWDLHPQRGGVARHVAERIRGNVPVASGSRIRAVGAPPDERAIEFDVDVPDAPSKGHVRALIIEFVPQRWNAFALGSGRRVTAMLRASDVATRALAPGRVYVSPRPTLRLGGRAPLDREEWLRLLLPTPPADRRRRLLDSVAFTSPINADYILGEASRSAASGLLQAAWERYREVESRRERTPCTLGVHPELQPYSTRLGTEALQYDDLLSAFAAALEARGEAVAPVTSGATLAREAQDAVRARLARLDARIEHLRRELADAPAEATGQRRIADLLLSRIHDVPRGVDHVDLDDLSGGVVRVPLDPALGPADNAARLYDRARKRELAARRLPGMVARGELERNRLARLADRIAAGHAEEDELREAAGLRRSERGPRVRKRRLPYRNYRTTSGLEVRVGRSAAANDALTLHHSSPDDIWMHARDAAGAHVVLRWRGRDGNPPAADLAEAAVLAALHSRARTSGTVPVDWTRRRYVRKPRKSKPGVVVIERARTLFVEPDEALERRLRVDDGPEA